MYDKLLKQLLKYKKHLNCKYCQTDLLAVDITANSLHTMVIPNKDKDIEVQCPSCSTINVFTKQECVNKKVSCLKCNQPLDRDYPGMPKDIKSQGKNTIFYNLKITCPNANCAKVNELSV